MRLSTPEIAHLHNTITPTRTRALTTPSPSAECIYSKSWLPPPSHDGPSTTSTHTSSDDAKLIFGTVFSLRNMVQKLGGSDDAFVSFRTAHYKLHYYESPSSLRLVMLTDTATLSMRNVLHQIYINLWVEYGTYINGRELTRVGGGKGGIAQLVDDRLTLTIVVKNPLSPVEHKGGRGVKNELFELGLDQFIRGLM